MHPTSSFIDEIEAVGRQRKNANVSYKHGLQTQEARAPQAGNDWHHEISKMAAVRDAFATTAIGSICWPDLA